MRWFKPLRVAIAGALLVFAVAGCSLPSAGEVTPSLSVGATSHGDPLTAVAQRVADRLIDGLPTGSVKAAAYVTTTATAYGATLPDTAGFSSPPPSGDAVIVVEIEGWWPAQHSCPGGSMCVDTGVFVAYDLTLGATLDTTFEDDPWSPDAPSPGPSVSERFHVLRHWGTPIPLQVPS